MTGQFASRPVVLWFSAAVALLLGYTPMLRAGEASARLPVPDASAQGNASTRVQDVFKDKFAAATTRERQKALAQELFQKAQKTTDNSTSQYVLLKEAERLAVSAKSADLALQIIKTMGTTFDVDAFDLKSKALTSISKSSVPQQERGALLSGILDAMEEAVAQDSYDVAGQLGASAIEVARRSKDAASVKHIVARTKEIKQLAKFYAEVKEAAVVLEKAPTDPDANLAVGRYRCYIRGQWSKGIPMLALGSDATLRNLAIQELKGMTDSSKQAALGDSWWQLAEQEEGVAKRHVQEQAQSWYQHALPGLSASMKEKVENRLKAMQQLADAGASEKMKRNAAGEAEKVPPAAGARKVLIYPGLGLDAVHLGDDADHVRAAFGQPDKIRTLSSGSSMLEYRASRGLDLLVRGERQLVVEMHFDQRFDGRTTGGIGIGDSMDQVLRVSGGASKTIEAAPEDTRRARLGNDRVLYKEMVDGRVKRLKFSDGKRGINYWCNADGRVFQITVYAPGR